MYESAFWSVFLSDEQDYIGRCILVLKRHCNSMTELANKIRLKRCPPWSRSQIRNTKSSRNTKQRKQKGPCAAAGYRPVHLRGQRLWRGKDRSALSWNPFEDYRTRRQIKTMGFLEFSGIAKCEETIQRTWEDFRSALATGAFSYNELDAVKANSTFLRQHRINCKVSV